MSGERHLDMGALEVDDACSRWRVAISDDVVIGEVAVDDQPRRGAVAAVFQVADQPPARRRVSTCDWTQRHVHEREPSSGLFLAPRTGEDLLLMSSAGLIDERASLRWPRRWACLAAAAVSGGSACAATTPPSQSRCYRRRAWAAKGRGRLPPGSLNSWVAGERSIQPCGHARRRRECDSAADVGDGEMLPGCRAGRDDPAG